MADITASMVKTLREATGQGMMDCKKALQECDGDSEAAMNLLRKKGGEKAATKAARDATEGLVAIVSDSTFATLVEISCETDFCARNDLFKAMVAKVAKIASDAPAGEIEATDAITTPVQEVFNKIGENMKFARGVKISAPAIGTYRHFNGKVGVILGIDGEITDELLTDICMHIAFADPIAITAEDVPADIVAEERKFILEQVMESGKPKEIAEKMVDGKMRKFLSGKALLEQFFVKDDKKQVKEVLGDAKITAFARYAIG